MGAQFENMLLICFRCEGAKYHSLEHDELFKVDYKYVEDKPDTEH